MLEEINHLDKDLKNELQEKLKQRRPGRQCLVMWKQIYSSSFQEFFFF